MDHNSGLTGTSKVAAVSNQAVDAVRLRGVGLYVVSEPIFRVVLPALAHVSFAHLKGSDSHGRTPDISKPLYLTSLVVVTIFRKDKQDAD